MGRGSGKDQWCGSQETSPNGHAMAGRMSALLHDAQRRGANDASCCGEDSSAHLCLNGSCRQRWQPLLHCTRPSVAPLDPFGRLRASSKCGWRWHSTAQAVGT